MYFMKSEYLISKINLTIAVLNLNIKHVNNYVPLCLYIINIFIY